MIVGAAVCRAAVLASGVPPGVVCLSVGGVLAVGVGAGAGVAVVWCWRVSCCPVLLVVGGLLVLAYTRTIAKKGSLDQE